MREVDELLRRRPGLGTLAAQARVLRARLAEEHGSSAAGASALTAAELRLLPLLSTHLSFPEIAAQMFLSPQHHQVAGDLGSSPEARCRLPQPGGQPGPVSWGSWRGEDPAFTHQEGETHPR